LASRRDIVSQTYERFVATRRRPTNRLTAPLTEIIDHTGYFIQMSMASLPIWLEHILNDKYPKWRDVEYDADGSSRYMPAGLRVVEASLLRRSVAVPARRRRRSAGRVHHPAAGAHRLVHQADAAGCGVSGVLTSL